MREIELYVMYTRISLRIIIVISFTAPNGASIQAMLVIPSGRPRLLFFWRYLLRHRQLNVLEVILCVEQRQLFNALFNVITVEPIGAGLGL